MFILWCATSVNTSHLSSIPCLSSQLHPLRKRGKDVTREQNYLQNSDKMPFPIGWMIHNVCDQWKTLHRVSHTHFMPFLGISQGCNYKIASGKSNFLSSKWYSLKPLTTFSFTLSLSFPSCRFFYPRFLSQPSPTCWAPWERCVRKKEWTKEEKNRFLTRVCQWQEDKWLFF